MGSTVVAGHSCQRLPGYSGRSMERPVQSAGPRISGCRCSSPQLPCHRQRRRHPCRWHISRLTHVRGSDCTAERRQNRRRKVSAWVLESLDLQLWLQRLDGYRGRRLDGVYRYRHLLGSSSSKSALRILECYTRVGSSDRLGHAKFCEALTVEHGQLYYG